MTTNTAPAQSSNHIIAILAALYSIVLCIFQVCAGTLAGLISGGLNTLSTAITESGGTADSTLGEATGLTGIFSILLIVIGIGMLIAAIGIFMRRPWSWLLTIGVHIAYVAIVFLSGGVTADNIVTIGFVIISAAIAAVFFFMPDIKRALNAA